MRIVLIGFMGTGKSSVAPLLAAKLGLKTVEMDDLIVPKAGGKSIEQIFANSGEAGFRRLELAVAKDLANEEQAVISTGGGVVTNQATLDYLAQNSTIIGLFASFETILARIGQNLPRPLFQDKVQAKTLYDQRRPLYNQYSGIRVTTDDKSLDEVVAEIVTKVQNP